MAKEQTQKCWACDKEIPIDVKVCPACDMPIEDSDGDIDDLDAFLDDMSTDASEDSDGPAIPSFDDEPAIPSFDDEPAIPSFDDEPAIPSFDDEEIDIPSFASELLDSELIEEPKPVLETEEVVTPVEPKVEIPLSYKIDKEIEGIDISAAKYSLGDIPLNTKLKLFLPQLVYWTFVFSIISLTGVTVTNPNYVLDTSFQFNPSYFEITTDLFIFGWLSFLAMGWFYKYKLDEYKIDNTIKNGILYLVFQFIMVTLVTLLLVILISPEMQRNVVFTNYIVFIWLGYVFSGLTFGFFLFFLTYKYYWNNIYEMTPKSKVNL